MIKYDFSLDSKIDDYPYKLLELTLTNNCNLACKYCFVQQGHEYMSLDTAKKGIDFIANNLYTHKYKIKDIPINFKTYILFFGGEPLLLFDDMIVPIVKYCEKTYPMSFNFVITTNGTLLTEEKCKFFAEHNFKHIMISFDGIKQIQDNNRPHQLSQISSYDLIIKNIQYIKKYQLNVTARATVTEESVKYLYETYLLFEQLGFSSCRFQLEYYTNLINNHFFLNTLQEQSHKIYQYRKLQYQQNIKPIILHISQYGISLILQQLLFKIQNNLPEIKPLYINTNCGYGLNEINLDCKGNIYPCKEEVLTNSTDTMIGSLDTGINFKKLIELKNNISIIENNFLQNQTCNNNCLFKLCNLPCQYFNCPSHSLQYKQIYISECKFFECFFKEIINVMYDLIKEDNQTFLRYLNLSYKEYQMIYMESLFKHINIKDFMLNDLSEKKDIIFKLIGD